MSTVATVFVDAPAHVRAPATSANLGPGFDALGLALTLWDEASAAVTSEGLAIEVSGEGGGSGTRVPRDETHLVVAAMRATFAELGGQPPGLALTARNRIPHGRGLGSSAAAIVSGVLLARALVRDGAARLDDRAAFALATRLEGHPDNVAACLFGGFTVAWADDTGPHAVRTDVVEALRPLVLIPPTESSTSAARGLLPVQVPHGDAAFTAGRTALLGALLTGAAPLTPDALLAATDDRLHQPYRAASMAPTAELVARLRAEGLAAVVSGAGPTVLVLLTGGPAAARVEVEQVRPLVPQGWRVARLAVDRSGAAVTVGPAMPAAATGDQRDPDDQGGDVTEYPSAW